MSLEDMLSCMEYTISIGIFGATLLLLAFVCNQLHFWKDEYLIYDLCNFFGGSLMVWYALLLGAYPFAVLNAVWAIVSFRDVCTDALRNSRRRERGFFRKWMR